MAKPSNNQMNENKIEVHVIINGQPHQIDCVEQTKPASPLQPNEGDRKYWIDRWSHQNTLLWSRVQTLGVIQVGVLAGWYALITADEAKYNYIAAAGVAFFGIYLTDKLRELIKRDDSWRKKCMKEAGEDRPPFMDANVDGQPGYANFKGICSFFNIVNWALLVLIGREALCQAFKLVCK